MTKEYTRAFLHEQNENGKEETSLRLRPTMQDVAEAAGVSLKTVSRVVNDEPRVGEDTKERVNKAILALGFRRNDIARSLRRGQSSATIGLVIEDIANPFYSSIAHGVEEIARQHGYMVIISNSEENPIRERELVNALFRRRVDGLLIVPAGRDHSYMLPEIRLGTPAIFLDRPSVHLPADTIMLDNRGGACCAIEHLLAYGHRRIGLLCGNPYVHTGAQRIEGYREALHAQGIAFDEELLRFGCDDTRKAQEGTHALLALKNPPTALFTTNNRISVSVLRALQQRTERIAFVGFDDLELAEMLSTPVTVVAHDATEMGRQAAQLLLARLAGDDSPLQQLIIPTELIIRGSGEIRPTV